MFDCTIVVLGATGDLAKRKLFPALYRLVADKKVGKFAIVGASVVDTTIDAVWKRARPHISKVDAAVWRRLKSVSYYQHLDFYSDDDWVALGELITKVEKKHKLPGNRLFYLATMPEHFATITDQLSAHKIAHKRSAKGKTWSRVVYEKPFGEDLASARTINKAIAKVFDEDQVFRIDHYLGKELVGNIAIVRFTNLFLQPLWNREYIDSIQIISSETIGIEGRGEYYDRYGALKDVVQNHMLQMLALVAMESPKQLAGEEIRDAKVAVFKKTKIVDATFGQYAGYRSEKGVPRSSKTETFVALRIEINNKRWKGVPFFLKTGKHLKEHETSIHIKFKHPQCLLAKGCPTDPNYLTIRVQPDEGFFLELNAKVPDKAYEITPVKMDFCHSCIFGPNTPGAYEVLLVDIMRGDQSVFVRFDEIELTWKILDSLSRRGREVHPYRKGSDGPKELESFNRKHKVRWRL